MRKAGKGSGQPEDDKRAGPARLRLSFVFLARGLLEPFREPEGHVWTPPPVQENFWTAAARDRVLPCVRPLLRRLTGRGPVWEFVDQVHITEARSKRSPFAWFS